MRDKAIIIFLQPILNGRDSVRKVLETFQERGGEWAKIATQYYGPVIENFTCDKTIYTAVEVSDIVY
jgi:structural maintenance of chromosome 3 (chondroitin sulfate proteoglycan 6)